MGEGDHEAAVFEGDESDRFLETGRQKSEKFPIAGMRRKRVENRCTDKRSKDRFGCFHGGIIASLLLILALEGCGYKTDPVYTPPVEKNVTDGSFEKI